MVSNKNNCNGIHNFFWMKCGIISRSSRSILHMNTPLAPQNHCWGHVEVHPISTNQASTRILGLSDRGFALWSRILSRPHIASHKAMKPGAGNYPGSRASSFLCIPSREISRVFRTKSQKCRKNLQKVSPKMQGNEVKGMRGFNPSMCN